MDEVEQFAPPEAGPAALSASEVWGILQVQWKVIVVITAVVVTLALVVSLMTTRLYRSTAVIQISPEAGQEARVSEVVDYDHLSQEHTYLKTQLDLLESRDLLEDVVRRYEKFGTNDLTLASNGAGKLNEMLSANQRKDSEFVDITITDTDPERAARLANLVADAYYDKNLDGRKESALSAEGWLTDQLTEYNKRVVDGTTALMAYESGHDLADAEQQTTQLSASMDALNAAFGEVNTKRVLLETTVQGHEQLLAQKQYEALAKDMNTPLVSSLTDEYSAAATENAKIRARYLEGMPERQYSDARLAGIEAEFKKEVERTLATEKAQLEILRAKEKSLSAEIDAAKSRLLDRQGLHEQYERLKLDLDRNKAFYATLSQRQGELELAAQTKLSNVRRIDKARANTVAVSPNIPFNLMLGILVGISLGCVVGFLIEYLDDTISTPFDVSTYLRVPFLGMVPRISDGDASDDRRRALYTQEHQSSAAAEAVRSIRTVLELNPAGKSLRRVLVTSSFKSEGKTNTIVSLAVSFAILGRRVLMIDADMRRPRLHHVFGLPKTSGLSTVLAGGDLADAIVPTGVEGLDLLPAGTGTDRPNELLASTATSDLLDLLDTQYDMIFIDTPPASSLSDAAILSKLVDGVVFVVREKTVSRWLVRDVVFRLQQVGAIVIGVVVNNVDLTGPTSKYKYHYNYRYRYYEYEKPARAAK